MPTADRMTSLERRSVAALSGVYVFRMLGLFMVLPVMSLYGEEWSGSTPALLGLALGIYGLSQALLQIPFGMLSDRIGRKPVLVAGLLLFGAGSLLAAAADTIGGVIAGRALQGAGAIASTLMALLSDLTREQHRTKAMAAIGMGIGLSFAVALVLGPLLAGWLGVSGIFALTAVLAGIGLALLLGVVPTPHRAGPSAETLAIPAMLGRCLRDRELLRLDLGIFVLHLVMMASFVVVPLLLADAGFERSRHWLIYLPVLLLSFVLMFPALMVAERRGKSRPIFLAAVALLALALLMLVFAGARALPLLAALLVFFVGFNLLEASLPSLVSRTVYAGGKGTAMGVYSSSQFMGAFVGGTLGGTLLQRFGPEAVFALCAAACVLWLLVAWSMRVPPRYRSVVFEFDAQAPGVEELDRALRNLAGVHDVTVIGDQGVAYIKVEPGFERSQLDALRSG